MPYLGRYVSLYSDQSLLNMNLQLLKILLATAIVFTSGISNSIAQEQAYSIPERVEFIEEDNQYLISYFLPIGWSTNGKFAYITEPADEACGCYFFEIAVIDLVTDKIVWQWELEGEPENETLQTAWNKNKSLFEQKLNEFGIRQQTNFELGETSFKSGINNYQLNLESSKNGEWEFQNIKSIKIEISSPELGSKVIMNSELEEYSYKMKAELVGHLKSPFEERIAVIYCELIRGWEGFPYVANFKLSGSHLTVGFK